MSPQRSWAAALSALLHAGLTIDRAALAWEADTRPVLMLDLQADLREYLAGTVRIVEQRLGLYGRCTCKVDNGCYQPAGNDGLCGYCHRWHREAETDRGHLGDGQAA